jgi:hypothetical protein
MGCRSSSQSGTVLWHSEPTRMRQGFDEFKILHEFPIPLAPAPLCSTAVLPILPARLCTATEAVASRSTAAAGCNHLALAAALGHLKPAQHARRPVPADRCRRKGAGPLLAGRPNSNVQAPVPWLPLWSSTLLTAPPSPSSLLLQSRTTLRHVASLWLEQNDIGSKAATSGLSFHCSATNLDVGPKSAS